MFLKDLIYKIPGLGPCPGSLENIKINKVSQVSKKEDLLDLGDLDKHLVLSRFPLDLKGQGGGSTVFALPTRGEASGGNTICLEDPDQLDQILIQLLQRLQEDQARLIQENELINNAFMEMNIKQASIQDYISFLSETIGADIAYYSRLDYSSYRAGEDFIGQEDLEDIRRIRREQFFVEKIEQEGDLYAYLVINKSQDRLWEKDLLLIEYTSAMILIRIQNQIAIDSSKEIVRSDLIADLCMNNIKSKEEVIFRANLQGWEIKSSGLLAVIFDIDEFKHSMLHSNKDIKQLEEEKQLIYNFVIREMEAIDYDSYYYRKSDSIIFLVNVDLENNLWALDQFIGDYISPIHRGLNKLGLSFTLTIGIGSYYDDIMQTYRSYNEAIESINISRIFKEVDDIACYKDLIIFKDLMEIMSKKDYNSIYTNLVENLIDLDRKKGTDYFFTLKTIIKNDWNLKDSSQQLFIHYNTIIYRFDKIKELLGMGLDNFYEKLIITLTVMLLEVEKHIDFNKGMFKK